VTLAYVCIGAAIGAPLRYLTDRLIQSRHDTLFPWGTFAVNIIGSLILGILTGAASQSHLSRGLIAAVGTGFCGTLTTYSTFSYETFRLAEDGARLLAALNLLVSIAAGLCAAVLGYLIGRML
jgi:CrcB protein